MLHLELDMCMRITTRFQNVTIQRGRRGLCVPVKRFQERYPQERLFTISRVPAGAFTNLFPAVVIL